jgi:hypothetical protein
VALKRRETAELIAEELRRLDPDDTYASALRFGVERLNAKPAVSEQPEAGDPVASEEPVAVPEPVEEAAKAPAKKATKKAPAKKAAAK